MNPAFVSLYFVSIQLKILSASSQRYSQQLDTTVVSWDSTYFHLWVFDYGVHRTCLCFKTAFSACLVNELYVWNFNSGLFSRRLSHLWVWSRHLVAVLPWFTRLFQATSNGRLKHGLIAHADAIVTAAAYCALVCNPTSCLSRHWWGYVVGCSGETLFWYQGVLRLTLIKGSDCLGDNKTEGLVIIGSVNNSYGYYCRQQWPCMHIWSTYVIRTVCLNCWNWSRLFSG